jgi:phosphoglycolate phosphatase
MLFIFDWDGTLLDSTDKIVSCLAASIAEVGLPARENHQLKEIIGLGLIEAFKDLFPGVDHDAVMALRETYAKHFKEADRTPCPFYPNAKETLVTLKERGHNIAVATGKSRKGLNRVLGNLEMETFFHGSRCADETRSKPHPLMLHELLEEFSITPQEAVMIGDTEFDMGMAKNADVPRIAVSYGAHAIERLQAYDPLMCVDRMDQILNLEL